MRCQSPRATDYIVRHLRRRVDRQELVETWFFHLIHNFASPGLVLAKPKSKPGPTTIQKPEKMVSQKETHGNGSVRESRKKRTCADIQCNLTITASQRSVASTGGAGNSLFSILLTDQFFFKMLFCKAGARTVVAYWAPFLLEATKSLRSKNMVAACQSLYT